MGTRSIAAAAGVPMSAITYHFGGKHQLHIAVAREAAERLRREVSGLLGVTSEVGLEAGGAANDLVHLLDTLRTTLLAEELRHEWSFVLLESLSAGASRDIIGEVLVEPTIMDLAAFLRRPRCARSPMARDLQRAAAVWDQICANDASRSTLPWLAMRPCSPPITSVDVEARLRSNFRTSMRALLPDCPER